MSNYAEDYMQSDLQGKLDILNLVYNMESTTRDQKRILAVEAQKIYDQLRERSTYRGQWRI